MRKSGPMPAKSWTNSPLMACILLAGYRAGGPCLKTRERAARGFTLVEIAIVLGIVAVLSAIVVGAGRWMFRSANVDVAADELAVRLAGLPGSALMDGRDRVFVLLDRGTAPGSRARTFVLTGAPATWRLSDFDPSSSTVPLDEVQLPRTARLLPAAESAAPAPLQEVRFSDSRLLGTCGGVSCFAIRYVADGEVRGEAPAGGDAGAPGFGFVLVDEQDAASARAGAKRRAIVVGFPTGIVKSYAP
jgi:prepilin-type N-terminal cleavage/methylation domain-containing protein